MVTAASEGWSTHPASRSARKRAAAGDKEAAKWIKRRDEAELSRFHIVRAMGATEVAATVRQERASAGEMDRVAVRAVDVIDDTGEVLRVNTDGRMVRDDWLADPAKAARSIDRCERAWGLHNKAGEWGGHAYGCRSQLCPLCAGRRAGERVQTYHPRLMALVKAGFRLVSVTLTQRTDRHEGDGAPTVLTMKEAKRFGMSMKGEGSSVPGESLSNALARFKRSFTTLRNGTGSREWWNDHNAGYLYGVEFTGIRWSSDGPWLRWHVHLHMLAVLPPRVSVSAYRKGIRDHWCRVSAGAAPDCQVVKAVGKAGQSVSQACAEVLKYPFKAWELTRAQLVDALATTKGLRWHLPGGCMHSSSTIGREALALSREEEGTEPSAAFSGWRRRAIIALADARRRQDEPSEAPPAIAYRKRTSYKLRGPAVPPTLANPNPPTVTFVPTGIPGTRERSPRDIVAHAGDEWIPVLLAEVRAYNRTHGGDWQGEVLLRTPGSAGTVLGIVGLPVGRVLAEVEEWRPGYDDRTPDGPAPPK